MCFCRDWWDGTCFFSHTYTDITLVLRGTRQLLAIRQIIKCYNKIPLSYLHTHISNFYLLYLRDGVCVWDQICVFLQQMQQKGVAHGLLLQHPRPLRDAAHTDYKKAIKVHSNLDLTD